jgi:hypothetical protein
MLLYWNVPQKLRIIYWPLARLNEVEMLFRLLSRKTLRGASFQSKDQLRDSIAAFVQNHNQNPKPFRWRNARSKGVNCGIRSLIYATKH